MEIKHETVALCQRQRKPRRGINRLSLIGRTNTFLSERKFSQYPKKHKRRQMRQKGNNVANFIYINTPPPYELHSHNQAYKTTKSLQPIKRFSVCDSGHGYKLYSSSKDSANIAEIIFYEETVVAYQKEKPFNIFLSKHKKSFTVVIKTYGLIYGKEGNGIENFICKTEQNYNATVRRSEIKL